MDSSFQFSLSVNGYKNIQFSSLPNDFTFIVNGNSFHTNRIIADFISPKISKIHASDPTFNTYNIEMEKLGNFNDIIKLGQLKELTVTNENADFIKEAFEKLGNLNFYDSLETYYDQLNNEDINSFDIYNYIEKLIIKEKLGSTNLNKEIIFISQHFYEIDNNIEVLSKFTPSLLEDIFQSKDLCITSEDSLVSILLSLGPTYYHLFEYVYFSEITKKAYKKFSDTFSFDFLNSSIWKSINNRILHYKNREDEYLYEPEEEKNDEIFSKRYKNKKEIIVNFDSDFNGIIYHLIQVGQGNPHRKKLMNVTSSSIYFDHFPESCLDTFEDTYFASEDSSDQWILFDFKHNEVVPTFYLLRSQYDFVNNLKSWKVEASLDGIEWILIDKRIDVDNLKEKNVWAKFKVQKPVRCRFIRLTQLGANWNNNEFLILSGVEFLGKFISFV